MAAVANYRYRIFSEDRIGSLKFHKSYSCCVILSELNGSLKGLPNKSLHLPLQWAVIGIYIFFCHRTTGSPSFGIYFHLIYLVLPYWAYSELPAAVAVSFFGQIPPKLEQKYSSQLRENIQNLYFRCSCQSCEPMLLVEECGCCQEIPQGRAEMIRGWDSPTCYTELNRFDPVCRDEEVLRIANFAFIDHHGNQGHS